MKYIQNTEFIKQNENKLLREACTYIEKFGSHGNLKKCGPVYRLDSKTLATRLSMSFVTFDFYLAGLVWADIKCTIHKPV